MKSITQIVFYKSLWVLLQTFFDIVKTCQLRWKIHSICRIDSAVPINIAAIYSYLQQNGHLFIITRCHLHSMCTPLGVHLEHRSGIGWCVDNIQLWDCPGGGWLTLATLCLLNIFDSYCTLSYTKSVRKLKPFYTTHLVNRLFFPRSIISRSKIRL
jgi:hypothetical protein